MDLVAQLFRDIFVNAIGGVVASLLLIAVGRILGFRIQAPTQRIADGSSAREQIVYPKTAPRGGDNRASFWSFARWFVLPVPAFFLSAAFASALWTLTLVSPKILTGTDPSRVIPEWFAGFLWVAFLIPVFIYGLAAVRFQNFTPFALRLIVLLAAIAGLDAIVLMFVNERPFGEWETGQTIAFIGSIGIACVSLAAALRFAWSSS